MADIENENNNAQNGINTEGNSNNGNKKSRFTALVLCWFLGFLGIHRMYAGKIGSGFLMLYGTIFSACVLYLNLYFGLIAFTVVGAFVVNDFLRIAKKIFTYCYGNYIEEDNV